jgi:hypothetical protein
LLRLLFYHLMIGPPLPITTLCWGEHEDLFEAMLPRRHRHHLKWVLPSWALVVLQRGTSHVPRVVYAQARGNQRTPLLAQGYHVSLLDGVQEPQGDVVAEEPR